MTEIKFEQIDGQNLFSFKDKRGLDFAFEYKPSIQGLWQDLNVDDFDVELIIHPFLNKESNVFPLKYDLGNGNETVGYIFPISVLDSDSFQPNRHSDNNYLFVAYKVLLSRLAESDWAIRPEFCDNFEDNLCVCILNLITIGKEKNLSNCIHVLRRYGYSYFVDNNNYQQIEGYLGQDYKDLILGYSINVDFAIPYLYSESLIDGIMRSLPMAHNIIHRFLLLYQIIEFIISDRTSVIINEAITKYKGEKYFPQNDFIETITQSRKERGIVQSLVDGLNELHRQTVITFNNNCDILFSIAGIAMDKLPFYCFRNQMVHSFRHLIAYEEELASTMFWFEQVVYAIVEEYR